MGKVKEQEQNIMEIPSPFMSEKEIKEFEDVKLTIIENREKKVKDAISNLNFYSNKYTVLDYTLDHSLKGNDWHFNNSLKSIIQAAKDLLENLELLSNKKD